MSIQGKQLKLNLLFVTIFIIKIDRILLELGSFLVKEALVPMQKLVKK